MSANYTTNKQFIQPLNGTYNNTWDQPVNADWGAIDRCFGGNTTISVTGIAAGVYTLSLTQYQPQNIIFSGTMSGNLAFLIPVGVGGRWSVYNNTNGAFTLTFGSSGGSSLTLTQGARTAVCTDGATMAVEDTATSSNAANAAQSSAEAYAAAQASAAQAEAIASATSLANAAQAASETYANGTSGTNANGTWLRLPGGQLLQWGTVAGQPSSPLTVTLPTKFTTCQSIVLTQIGQSGSFDVQAVAGVTTTFIINFGASNTPFSWSAYGL